MNTDRPPRITSAKLIALGTLVALVAAAVAIAIWQSKPHGGFLQVPGWCAVAAFAVGAVLVLVGFWRRDHDRATPLTQTQRGGAGSQNYQAGGDINVLEREKGPR